MSLSRTDFKSLISHLISVSRAHAWGFGKSAHARSVQVYDNAELGKWVHEVRKQHKLGILGPERIKALDELDFAFTTNTVTSKWHYCFHEARRYKVGSGLPFDCSRTVRPARVQATADDANA